MKTTMVALLALVSMVSLGHAESSLPIEGKGMWIWQLWTPADSNLTATIDRLKSEGVNWVVVKVGDSDSYYNRSGKSLYNWAANHGGMAGVVSTFHANGIKIFGYQYVRGYSYWGNGVSEADVANMILDIHGIDGLLIDAEIEYDTLSNRVTAAQAYLDTIRAYHPASFIGLTAWARVAVHITFPWTTFLDGVGVNMPQTYWAARPVTPATELSRMSSDFTYYTGQWVSSGDSAAAKPIMPIGQAEYFGYGSNVFPGDIQTFCTLSQETYKYPGVSLWEFAQIDSPYVWSEYAAAWPLANISNLGGTPESYLLEQNYPNPFNPVTVISYRLSAQSRVTLKIYDVLGREVETLLNDVESAGSYNVKFNGSGLASGVYFYWLRAGGFSAARKMVLMK